MVTAYMPYIMGFSRQEASCIVGIDYHNIVYLERAGLIDVKKLDSFKKGSPIYTLRQLVCLLIVEKYRKQMKKDVLRMVVDFVENNLAVAQLEDTTVVCINLSSKTSKRNITSVGYIRIGESILDVFKGLEKQHSEQSLELVSEDKWDIDIEVISPIRKFIEQILDNAKRCEDIDYNDFLQRAGLEGY